MVQCSAIVMYDECMYVCTMCNGVLSVCLGASYVRVITGISSEQQEVKVFATQEIFW